MNETRQIVDSRGNEIQNRSWWSRQNTKAKGAVATIALVLATLGAIAGNLNNIFNFGKEMSWTTSPKENGTTNRPESENTSDPSKGATDADETNRVAETEDRPARGPDTENVTREPNSEDAAGGPNRGGAAKEPNREHLDEQSQDGKNQESGKENIDEDSEVEFLVSLPQDAAGRNLTIVIEGENISLSVRAKGNDQIEIKGKINPRRPYKTFITIMDGDKPIGKREVIVERGQRSVKTIFRDEDVSFGTRVTGIPGDPEPPKEQPTPPDPQAAKKLFDEGMAFFHQEKYEKAKEKFIASHFKQRRVGTFVALSITCYMMDDRVKAEDFARRAVLIDRENAFARWNLGAVLLHIGKEEEGEKYINSAKKRGFDPHSSGFIIIDPRK